MRAIRLLVSVAVLLACFSGLVVCNAQTVPANATPFVSEVTPPSLAPGTVPTNPSSFTLTILGANFTPNVVVNLAPSPSYILHPSITTVNPSGSVITAQFTNVVLGSPGTFAVTVTNPSGTQPSTSNAYYLPYTPAQPSVVLNQNSTSFLTGSPKGVVAADFFGNGDPSLAVVSQNANAVSILRSNYTGPFTLDSSNPTGNQPWGIVAADILGTSVPDLAITNSADNTLTILYNNGGGTYRLGSTISLPGVFPTALVAADFNGDGKIDLAVLNTCGPGPGACYPQAAPQGPGSVTILLNNGDGTFTVSPAALTTGNVPFAMAAADLNGDGVIDLVVANQNSNNLTIFMGNGDGTFTPATASPATGNAPSAIAIGDFNGDGQLDLAITNSSDNTVSILLNQNCSSGPAVACTFVPTTTAPTVGAAPSAIATGDMNADGFLDLVVANSSDSTVSILLGDGTGNFQPVVAQQGQPNFSTGTSPQALVLADFDTDGRLDIVTSNSSGSFTYLRQAAVGQLVLTTSNPSPYYGLFVTFTANLIPPFGQSAPAGTMTFLDGSTPIGTVSLNSYQTYFQYPGLNAGSHQVTAVYSGDSNSVSITSNAVSETVTQAQTTTTLTSDVNTASYVQPFTLSATIQPQNYGTATGTVTFFDTSSSATLGSATPVNNVAQLTLSKLSPGAHVITAIYQGDANFTGSNSPTYTENIIQAPTTVSISASPNPINLGQSTTFTATIQPGTGNTVTGAVVFLLDGTTTLGFATVSNNSAQFTTSNLLAGTHAITAQYTGDTNFSGSTSSVLGETVNSGSVTVSLSSGTNPSVYGQAVTFTANVQPVSTTTTPTGTVTIVYGAYSSSTVTLSNGSAQLVISTLPGGANGISARYNGDSNFQPSALVFLVQNTSLAATSTTVTSSQNPSPYSQSVTFTANVQPAYGGSASGSVTFYDGATSLVSVTPTNNAAQFTISSLSGGTHSITARYAGDYNTNASVSPALSQSVTPTPTTTTLTSSVNPSAYGQTVTFVASVSPPASTAGGGTLSFYQDGTIVSAFGIATAPPQVVLSGLTAGTHSITAVFTPFSSNYAASTSSPVTQTVNQTSTTMTISLPTNPATYGQSIMVDVSVWSPYNLYSNGGTITLYDGGTSIASATVNGNGVNFPFSSLAVGAHSLTASFSGNANEQASTSPAYTETINQEPTVTSMASSSYTPAFAQAITLTANVKPLFGTTATGTITFLDRTTPIGTAALSNNSAQLTVSNLTAGSHSITAQYSGDANTLASTSAQAQVVVSPPPTTTLLTVDANPSSFNQPVTFTATLQLTSSGTPTGKVTFYDGSLALGTGTVTNGTAQLRTTGLLLVTHPITATYSGDTNFSGSTSAVLNQEVNPAATIVSLISKSNPSTVGLSVTFTVGAVGAFNGFPGGPFTLYDGNTVIGTGNFPGQTSGNNLVDITVPSLSAGSHSITAAYGGSTFYLAGTSAVLTQVMNLPSTSTYLSASANPASFGQTVVLSATVQAPNNAAATGTVTFYNGAASLGTSPVSGNSAQLSVSAMPVGSNSLTAKYSGDGNYAASTSASITETINSTGTTTTVSSNANPATPGQTITLTANVSPAFGGTSTGTITFFDGTTSLGVVPVSGNSAQLSLSTLSVGSHSITAKYSGDSNFSASTSAALSQTVNLVTTSTTVTSGINPAMFGQAVTFSVTVQSSASGTPTGTITLLDGTTSAASGSLASGSVQLTVTGLSGGSHSITAVYSGDANFAASTSSALAETVNGATSSTALTSSSGTATVGQTVTFTATVQPSAGSTASGTVTFYDGTTTIGAATLASNSAQLTVSTLTLGTHSITATYGGNGNLAPSSSAAVVETITQASTTLTITSGLDPAAFGQAVQFSGTVQTPSGGAATGTVTFFDGATSLGTATVTNNGVQHNSVTLNFSGFTGGTHTITASYSGDANYAASTSAPLTETVTQAPSTVSIASGLNPATFGQSVTLTATVQPSISGDFAGGTVTFYDGATALGAVSLSSDVVQLSFANLAAGSHSITAKYSGDGNFAGGTSSVLAETINQSSTTVTVASSANPSAFGLAITLSATIQSGFGGNATGTITFLDGAVSLGTSSVSGNAAQLSISSLAVGAHSITAKYSGDANFSASTSSAFSQTINQASTTATVTSSANPAAFGQSVIFTVKVQSSSSGTPTGTVSLRDGSTSLGSSALPSNGVAQFTVSSLSLGSHSITGTYSGDANFTGSASAALAQVVNQASTTTSLSSSANPSSYGQSVTFTASVVPSFGGAPTGTVKFLDGGMQIGTATVSASVASFTTAATALNPGSHSITASYSGDANFGGSSSATFSQVVNGAATTTTLVSSLNPSVAGQSVKFTATVSSAVSGTQSGTVSFYLDGSTTPAQSSAISGGAATFSTNSLSGGSHTVTAAFGSTNANFQGSSSAVLAQSVKDFSISASPASLTVSRSQSGTTALTLTPIAGFSGNVSLSCSGQPASTNCNVSPNQVTLNGTSSAQTTATIKVNGNATVGTYTLTLKGTSGSVAHSITVSLTIN